MNGVKKAIIQGATHPFAWHTLLSFALFSVPLLIVLLNSFARLKRTERHAQVEHQETIEQQYPLFLRLPLTMVIAIARISMKKIERYSKASREASGKVSGAIGEIVGAVQAIQVVSAEEYMVAHFQRLSELRLKQVLREHWQNDL